MRLRDQLPARVDQEKGTETAMRLNLIIFSATIYHPCLLEHLSGQTPGCFSGYLLETHFDADRIANTWLMFMHFTNRMKITNKVSLLKIELPCQIIYWFTVYIFRKN